MSRHFLMLLVALGRFDPQKLPSEINTARSLDERAFEKVLDGPGRKRAAGMLLCFDEKGLRGLRDL